MPGSTTATGAVAIAANSGVAYGRCIPTANAIVPADAVWAVAVEQDLAKLTGALTH